MRSRGAALALLPALAVLALPGAGEAAETGFRVKPPEIAANGAPGNVRRVIQPFGPWTLICDENLKKRSRICNASQQIVDAAGATIFSWSLAATSKGAPVMILRAPSGSGPVTAAVVSVPGTPPMRVALSSCNAALCLGFLPVSAPLRRAIDKGQEATIRLERESGATILTAPLASLMQAIKALK